MSRKDNIFNSFLKHDLLKEKYNLSDHELHITLNDGLKSDVPIIRSIAMFVESLEKVEPETDKALRNKITQYLNTAPI